MAEPVPSANAARIATLEHRDDIKDALIADLERENRGLLQRVEALEEEQDRQRQLQYLHKNCVFSARLKLREQLGTDAFRWKSADNVVETYHPSVNFLAQEGRFKAPVKGEYFMNLGFRQSDNYGGIEAMLVFPNPTTNTNNVHARLVRIHSGPNDPTGTDMLHAFVGETSGRGQVCDRSMVLTLNPGDKVTAVFRRRYGWADVSWCVMSGYLIRTDMP